MNLEMGTYANHPAPLGCMARSLVVVVALAFGLAIGSASVRSADDSAQKIEEGRKLFHERCGYCHLAGGTGAIMLARRLGRDRSLLEERTDLSPEYIKKMTRVGINGMPPHNRIELPDSELDLVAIYLTRPATARTSDAAKPKGGTP
jgi:mono/diheme cytochrome c family protein